MDNSQVLKLIQEQQKWDNIKYCITIVISAIPNLILLWQNYKKNKPNSKIRLIRVKAAKAKLATDAKSKQEKLSIEEAAIKEEAAHEAELRKMEVGHQPTENQLDFLSDLQQQGKNLIKNKLNQVNKVVDDKLKIDQLTSLTDKDKKDKE